MSRSVRSFLPVSGSPDELWEAFAADPTRWLPDARRAGPESCLMTVRAGQLSRVVEARVGPPWRTGSSIWRSMSWEPSSDARDGVPLERLLPSFDGEIGLHAIRGVATLVVDAQYRVPGGPLGEALDAAALQRVARGTIDRLLADVASRLTAESLLAIPEPVSTPEEHRVS